MDRSCQGRPRRAFVGHFRKRRLPAARLRIGECTAPDATLAARIRQRQAAQHDASDADLAVLALQQRVREPLAPDEGAERLDTAGSLGEVAVRLAALMPDA